jgi:thiol-disulfide isomerase/thioredoxin
VDAARASATWSRFTADRAWLNSEPLTADDLRGHVVLVDFWTYSCVNWLRTLPYVRAWADKYRDAGLVVVGVHAPEFGFEHDLDNVRRAIGELDVGYPVVIDNDFSIWRSFDNNYWPAVYLVDGDGARRFEHFGEGAYDETERALQDLLGVDAGGPLVDVDAGGLAEAADWERLGSPETYLGQARGERRTQAAAHELPLNAWSLDGDWSVVTEAAILGDAPGTLAYNFRARDLNLVMAPPTTSEPIPFRVSLDDAPPGDAAGLDVDADGNGMLAEPRMYQLIRQPDGAADRTFTITFLDPGARAYVFTFG